ncbi:MAG: hypothetical protein ACRETQ_03375 [Gammaproteobacteria bacterium]
MPARIKQIFPEKQDFTPATTGSAWRAKLEQLFENRNRIKYELDRALAERKLLQDELGSLRGRYLESQRQLSGLEHVLADAEHGQSALVYYRLRAVWNTCSQQLRSLAQDLNGRFANFERVEFDRQHDKERGRRLDELTGQFEQLERERRDLRANLHKLQLQMAGLRRFWQQGRRAVIQFQIDKVTRQFAPIEARKLRLLSAIAVERKQKPQSWPGICTASKRTVNLWLLALAQYLYLQLAGQQIAEMARSAGSKRIADVNFGSLNDCLAIGNHVREAVMHLRRDRSRPEALRFRTEHLRDIATYSSDIDTVPEESCLEYITAILPAAPGVEGRTPPVAANVLRLNYWNLRASLLLPTERVSSVERGAPGLAAAGSASPVLHRNAKVITEARTSGTPA